MPIYDFQCERKKCQAVEEHFCCINDLNTFTITLRCSKCRGHMKQVLNTKACGSRLYPFINEDFNGTPIEVRSKGHYKELCKKFGVQARALL